MRNVSAKFGLNGDGRSTNKGGRKLRPVQDNTRPDILRRWAASEISRARNWEPEPYRPRVTRNDGLPEGTRYTDDGCDVSPSCLECPLAVCKLDDPVNMWESRQERRRRIFELRKQRVPPAELQRAFKVSKRTVDRAIATGGEMDMPEVEQDELPGIDPYSMPLHEFKPRQKNAPAFRHKVQSAVYPKSCRTCGGDMCVNFVSREASCVQCSRLWGQVELGERSA